MATIGTAYIQIEPSTEGIAGSIEKTLNGEASKAGKSAGASLSSALGGTLKVGASALAAIGTAATATGAALYSSATATAQYGDSIDKMSQKMGVSAEFYQEWDAVLQHSGTSMDSMMTTFKTLSKSVQDGSSAQQEAYAQLGLSMEELKNMSTEEVFENVVAGLQQMDEGTERTALATTLLGRSAMEMGALLNTSAEDTQNMIDTVHELGGVMSNDAVKASAAFQDSIQDLGTAFSGIKNTAMSELLPSLTMVTDGIAGLLSGQDGAEAKIQEGMQGIVSQITAALPTLLDGLQTIIEPIIAMAPELLQALCEGIITALPTLLPQLIQILAEVTTMLIQLLPELVTGLIDGLTTTLPILISALPDLIIQLTDALIGCLPTLLEGVTTLVLGIVEALPEIILKIVDALPTLIEKLITGLITCLPQLIEGNIKLITGLVAALPQIIQGLITAIPQIFTSIVTAIVNCAPQMLEAASKLLEAFKKGFEKVKEIGKNIITGLWSGISDATEWLKSKIKGFCSSALGAIKDFFGIHSPSKVMADEVGKFLPKGLAVGIDANADSALDAMDSLGNRMNTTLTGNLQTIGADAKYGVQIAGSGEKNNDNLYGLLDKFLPQIAEGGNITLEGDMGAMFRQMQKQNDIYRKSNGRSAFA